MGRRAEAEAVRLGLGVCSLTLSPVQTTLTRRGTTKRVNRRCLRNHTVCQCGFSCQPTRLAREEEEREREEEKSRQGRCGLVWILLALSLPTVHRIGEHRHRPTERNL